MKKKQVKISITIALFALFAASCSKPTQTEEHSEEEVVATEEAEPEAEWIPLPLSKWRNFKKEDVSPIWEEEDGVISLTGKGAGDIITKQKFENFELELEWKISENGNSGIMYRVVEHDTLGATYHSGPEMQVLDNEGHADGKIKTHRAGDNYDMKSCSEETVKPVGEWNKVRLVINNGKVEHWLNGTMVVDYEFGSPEWEEQYQNSKFTQWPQYGQNAVGHIALQDHGDPVWFRNIRIREL
ncbi:DUF1080 domain-containing protein [Flammeovirgaceae bacterium SG7u.111]|nr:DUF1080 domain-containing protein [Flammeovirgaceae bacterium SG7u.132]WPO36386.1 DUF1080 domain-containing protein [Flammeovirgaceae bacterium SG7u.111]